MTDQIDRLQDAIEFACRLNHWPGFYGVIVKGDGTTESIIIAHPKVGNTHVLRHAQATIADDIAQGVGP
jgi:stage III sporulation protein SpoIIIAA